MLHIFYLLQILREHSKIKSLLEEFDKNENTPLHVAAMKGHVNIVEVLKYYTV